MKLTLENLKESRASVYYLDTNVRRGELAAHESLLNDDEKLRAKNFRFERDRERFIIARGGLRELLGKVLTTEPGELRFDYGVNGKPHLADLPELNFNLSHSGELVAYALAWKRQIGIDTEKIDACRFDNKMLKTIMTDDEIEFLSGVSRDIRHRETMKYWVCKEAVLKANGSGLSKSPNRIQLTATGTGQRYTVAFEDRYYSVNLLEICTGSSAGEYVGAVAAEGCDWSL